MNVPTVKRRYDPAGPQKSGVSKAYPDNSIRSKMTVSYVVVVRAIHVTGTGVEEPQRGGNPAVPNHVQCVQCTQIRTYQLTKEPQRFHDTLDPRLRKRRSHTCPLHQVVSANVFVNLFVLRGPSVDVNLVPSVDEPRNLVENKRF